MWDKAFGFMSKNIDDDTKNENYADFLANIIESNKDSFSEEEYANLYLRIRPENNELAKNNQAYWAAKYSPVVGAVQDWIYVLYLKGNKIESGRQNNSEVVGFNITYQKTIKIK